MYHWSLNAGGDNASQASCYVTQTVRGGGRDRQRLKTGGEQKQGSTVSRFSGHLLLLAHVNAAASLPVPVKHAKQQWAATKTVRTFWRSVICQGSGSETAKCCFSPADFDADAPLHPTSNLDPANSQFTHRHLPQAIATAQRELMPATPLPFFPSSA